VPTEKAGSQPVEAHNIVKAWALCKAEILVHDWAILKLVGQNFWYGRELL
jgi:hypothetical protein